VKKSIAILLCLTLLCLAGCAKKAEPAAEVTGKPKAETTPEAIQETPTPEPTPVEVESTEGRLSDAVLETEAFAYPLMQNLKAAYTDTNTVFSPVAMSSTLTALYAAAQGDTAEELRQMLSWMCEPEDAAATLKVLTDSIGSEFSSMNQVFLAERVKAGQNFSDNVAIPLGVKIASVNFADGAADAINAYASDVTGGKVAQLTEGTTAAEMLTVASGFVFGGTFDLAFDEKETEKENFESTGGLIPCFMMEMQSDLSYAEDEYMQLVSLPMNGGKQNMIFILPKLGMEQGFDEAFLQYAEKWLSQEITQSMNVELHLPRFTLSSGQDLTEVFADMGMSASLRAQTVNLEGILDESLILPTPISAVYSVGSLTVTEGGVNVRKGSGTAAQKTDSEETVEVTLDRPFMVAVTDTATAALLVLGWVNTLE